MRAAIRFHQMDEHARDCGFAASGFPDHAQRFAGRKRKATIIDGRNVAARAAEKPAPERKMLHQAGGCDDRSLHDVMA